MAQLKKLEANTDEIIGRAIYEGAGIVADAARSAINDIQTDERWNPPGTVRNGPRQSEKESLLNGFGISKLRQTGTFWNVKVGFHGMNINGMSNAGMARMIESGSSWMRKQPFMTRAVNSKKKECEDRMEQVFNEELEKLVK